MVCSFLVALEGLGALLAVDGLGVMPAVEGPDALRVVEGPGALLAVECPGALVAVEGPGAKLAVEGPGAKLAVEGPGAKLAVDGPGAELAVEGPGAKLEVECPGAKLAVEGPGAKLAVEGPGAKLAVEGPGAKRAVEGPGAKLAVECSCALVAVEGPGAKLAVEGPGALVTVEYPRAQPNVKVPVALVAVAGPDVLVSTMGLSVVRDVLFFRANSYAKLAVESRGAKLAVECPGAKLAVEGPGAKLAVECPGALDWTEGTIVKIPKKGAHSDCNNWRAINLLSIPSKILSKIIIQRISEAVDQQLRNEQAGFRKGRGCCDQIFTLRNIIEQCTEWQRQLYINFVDFEKAFDSIHRDSLWRILRAYGIPEKIVLLSTLEDLDFADDLALLSHTHNHMQEKTARLSNFAKQVGLKINKKKTEVIMLNISNQSPIEVNGENLPTTEEFTYLGSKVRHDGGAGTDIQSRLSKARNSFRMLNNVWRSSQYKFKTKLRLYQSCVLSTLLYGSECWRMTQSDLNKLSTFHTKDLRRILRISWPETISNQHLLARCNQLCMNTIIMQRRCRWLGHVMRKEQGNITRTALHWTPEGRRKRGRPKNTWRRTVESELKTMKHTWSSVQRLAQNRQEWRSFVAALHAMRHNGHE
ncbi:hypothetical protein EGW08_023614 [Elysia chlorotica]|uniref:Reverse transcriptase domain-containing protein n=1 Tax=Elysia chlorotica TaxID=188477 RepID=A0A433SIP7_ELYCH|nr:hypothetical protein EGW08_023614 [Elysia chlorotica]